MREATYDNWSISSRLQDPNKAAREQGSKAGKARKAGMAGKAGKAAKAGRAARQQGS